MLTMMVAEGAGVCGASHLWIIKVYNCEVAHGKRRQGVYKSEIQISNVALAQC